MRLKLHDKVIYRSPIEGTIKGVVVEEEDWDDTVKIKFEKLFAIPKVDRMKRECWWVSNDGTLMELDSDTRVIFYDTIEEDIILQGKYLPVLGVYNE